MYLRRPHTLIINRSDSRCGNCGKSADPHEKTHDRVLGYNPGMGCGTRWVLLGTDYSDFDNFYEGLRKMRPDLEFTGAWT